LLVSHNMGAIETLCKHGVLLDQNRLKLVDDIHQVVSTYLSMNYLEQENPFLNCMRSGSGKVHVTGFHLETPDGTRVNHAVSGCPIVFVIGFETNGDLCNNVSVGFSVHQNDERNLFLYYSHFSDVLFSNLPRRGEFRCLIPECPIAPGNFLVKFRILSNGIEADWPQINIPFSVHMGDFYRTGSFDGALASWGPLLVRGKWFVEP